MKALIITGGTVEEAFASEYLQKNAFDCLIAVDHGADAVSRLHQYPDVLLGDFDSADRSTLDCWLKADDIQIIRHNPIKDATDTELAITYAVENGFSEIVILGGTGTRMDHFLGTLHSMTIALRAGIDCKLIDAHNQISLMSPGTWAWKKEEVFGKNISFLPLTEKVEHVTLSGMKYPLSDGCFVMGNSLGVSNEITEESAVLSFSSGILIQIQSKD